MPPLKADSMSTTPTAGGDIIPPLRAIDKEQEEIQKTKNKTRRDGLRRRRVARSRSAPPGYNRGNKSRNNLVQQHFKIDAKNQALLPGVPVHDEDLARDLHDFFNLIFLLPIVVLNALNWDWNKLVYDGILSTSKTAKNTHFDVGFLLQAWTGEYFNYFFWLTVGYFLVDMIWVCVVPKCVRSPSTIIQHHIAVFVYLTIPYFFPKFHFLMGVCMSVELNTWFLIARRVFNKQGFPPWQFDIPYVISVRVKLISIFFYITWILIRCILYPYVLYALAFPLRTNKKFADSQNVILCAVILQAAFCFLNAQWTLQLVNSKIRQWKSKGETKVASGL